MADWLDETFNATEQIRRRAYALESLSMSFRDVGNLLIADRLEEIGLSLHESSNVIHGAAGKASKELLDSAQSGTFNMLSVALVMAEREKEKD